MDNRPANIGGHASVAAGVIVAYWLADGYVIGLPVAALAATWNPLIVYLGASLRKICKPVASLSRPTRTVCDSEGL